MSENVILDSVLSLSGTFQLQAGSRVAAVASRSDNSFARQLDRQTSRVEPQRPAAAVEKPADGTRDPARLAVLKTREAAPETTTASIAPEEITETVAAELSTLPLDELPEEELSALLSAELMALLQLLTATPSAPESAADTTVAAPAFEPSAPVISLAAEPETTVPADLLPQLKELLAEPEIDPKKLQALLERVPSLPPAAKADLEAALVEFTPAVAEKVEVVRQILQSMEKRPETAGPDKSTVIPFPVNAEEKVVPLIPESGGHGETGADREEKPPHEFKLLYHPAGSGALTAAADNVNALNRFTPEKLPEIPTEDPQRFIDQLVKNLALVNRAGPAEVRLQLKPEFLGRMVINLTLEEGVLTARFITESHQVKGMLEANMNALKQSLSENGVKVEKTEVDVQVNTGGAFERDLGQQQRSGAAWAEQTLERVPYSPAAGRDAVELLEENYALEPETDLLAGAVINDFTAGRMNLVI
jgi:hypothetical protein